VVPRGPGGCVAWGVTHEEKGPRWMALGGGAECVCGMCVCAGQGLIGRDRCHMG